MLDQLSPDPQIPQEFTIQLSSHETDIWPVYEGRLVHLST